MFFFKCREKLGMWVQSKRVLHGKVAKTICTNFVHIVEEVANSIMGQTLQKEERLIAGRTQAVIKQAARQLLIFHNCAWFNQREPIKLLERVKYV